MSTEAPRFKISSEVTEAVMDDADSHGETLEYAKGIMKKAKEKHPVLYRYLKDTARQQGEYSIIE